MNKSSIFLKKIISKIISWLIVFFYVFSSFFTQIAVAQSLKGFQSESYNESILNSQNNYSNFVAAEDNKFFLKKRSYVMVSGDTIDSIAKRYNLSVEGLRQVNKDRFFAHGFEQIKVGDTIYVPSRPVSDDMARYLEGGAAQNSGFAAAASQIGNFLAGGGHRDALTSMGRGYLTGKLNGSLDAWFNQFGTSRIQLNLDDDFSLKNSQIDLLLPIYDKGSKLILTQGSIHRSDDRTQVNLGLGYRYFAPDYMLGGNAFVDYDISRSHSRFGVGVEYWRDYLKLGINGYYRLSDWRVSPDVENYWERPASGWDIRAEGYLPSYPQLGLKLNFEQYFGSEVGLFGKNSRDENPCAVTFGVNYTPIPLLTFNLDRRQGRANNHETTLGFHVNYRFGVPLDQQLDPDAVNDMRTVAGGRYDLINRNNNIVLEYQKQEVIRLSMVGAIMGAPKETHSLDISVQSKYDVSSVNVMAASLIAAGGQIVHGADVSDYSVILPSYQQGASNQYIINAVATDVKGNSSKTAKTIVTAIAPKFSVASSTFTPTDTILPADGVSSQTLTLTLKTNEGDLYDASVDDIIFTVTGQNTSTVDSSFTRISAGVYAITVTAGTSSEVLTLTPSINNMKISSATIQFVGDITSAQISSLTLDGDSVSKAANGSDSFTFTVTVKDNNGNVVPSSTVIWSANNSAVTLSAATATTDINGQASLTITSTTTAALNVQISAQLNNNTSAVSADKAVSFVGDIKTASLSSVVLLGTVISKTANGSNSFIFVATVKDANGNAVSNVDVSWSVDKGNVSLSTILPPTDSGGITVLTLTSTKNIVYDIQVSATISNNSTPVQADKTVNFVADQDTAIVKTVELQGTETAKIANGSDSFTYIATVKDTNGNIVANAPITWSVNSEYATLSSTSGVTDENGQATVTLTSTTTADDNIIVSASGVYDAEAKNADQAVSFASDVPLSSSSTLALQDSSTSKVADGSNIFTFIATLKDSNGNVVSDGDITWSINTQNATLSATTSTTDGNGNATIVITSTKKAVNDIVISATFNNNSQTITGDKKVNFIGDATTAAVTSVALFSSTVSKVANGTNSFVFYATVKDANGNPVSNTSVTWSASSSDVTLSASATYDNGRSVLTLTSTTTAAYDIQVTAQAVANDAPVNADKTVSFVADQNTAIVTDVSLDGTTVTKTANGSDSFTYIAIVKDVHGNLVTNATVTWSVDKSGPTLSASTSVSDENGLARISLTSTTAVNNVTVSGKGVYDGLSKASNTLVNFITYTFAITPENKYITNATYYVYYTVTATPSNGGSAVAVTPESWTSSDTSIATISSSGSLTAQNAGDTVITAAGTYNGLSYSKTTNAYVRLSQQTPVYGRVQGVGIDMPVSSNTIYAHCGWIVDGIGDGSGGSQYNYVGGSGGDPKTLSNISDVVGGTVIYGTYEGSVVISQIIFNYKNKTTQSCGSNRGTSNTTTASFTVPTGYVIDRFAGSGTEHLNSLEFRMSYK